VRFRRPEGAETLERYITELPNKNCETIAQAVPGTSEQRRQEFLTNIQWDADDLNRQRVQDMIAEATLGDGVLVLDDTGFPKQGHASVGVARQYSGTLEELAGYAHRRYAVEQFHEEAKGELGWDQYQGRLWPGFHRHAATVMLAYSFLVWWELRQRTASRGRGRPRHPFSPSAGSAARHAPSRA
jgi:SRSO17 transposase